MAVSELDCKVREGPGPGAFGLESCERVGVGVDG